MCNENSRTVIVLLCHCCASREKRRKSPWSDVNCVEKTHHKISYQKSQEEKKEKIKELKVIADDSPSVDTESVWSKVKRASANWDNVKRLPVMENKLIIQESRWMPPEELRWRENLIRPRSELKPKGMRLARITQFFTRWHCLFCYCAK